MTTSPAPLSNYDFKFLQPGPEASIDPIPADRLAEMLEAVSALTIEPTLDVHVKGARVALENLRKGTDWFDLTPEELLHAYAFRVQYEAHCEQSAKVVSQLAGE